MLFFKCMHFDVDLKGEDNLKNRDGIKNPSLIPS